MAKDQSVSYKVTGLRELAAALKQMDVELPVELRTAFLGVAQKVADVTAQRMPWKTGAAAGSVHALATAKGASVAEGGRPAPYVGWLDFGGSTGRGHRPGVAWSGAERRGWMGKPLAAGRFLYPAIEQENTAIIDATETAVQRAGDRVGLKVS